MRVGDLFPIPFIWVCRQENQFSGISVGPTHVHGCDWFCVIPSGQVEWVMDECAASVNKAIHRVELTTKRALKSAFISVLLQTTLPALS